MLEFKLKDRFGDPNSAILLIRRLLVEHAAAQWKRYAVAFGLMAIAAASTAAAAYLIGTVINQTYVEKNLAGVIFFGIVAALIFVARGMATYGQILMMARINNRIVADNQRKMFAALIHQNVGFFSDRHSSEFMARLKFGATAASQVLNMLAGAIGRDLLSVIALVTVMVIQDPVMSLVGLVVAPPALLFLRKLVRRIYAIARNQFIGDTRLLETLQETVSGIRIVKAYTLEDTMRKRLDADVAEVEQLANRAARVGNRASPLMELLGGVAVALAIVYGGYRVIETGAAPGQFVSFLAAFLLAYEPAKRLARLNIELSSALVGVRVLFEIIDHPPTEPNEDHKPPLQLSTARIEFKNVRFAYRPGEEVLRGMSFVAEPGHVMALVGPSGAGKSTVLNLAMRFYEMQSGTITIDGQNIADVSRNSLRQQIAYVGQETFLFHGTIRDNIAIGKLGATEEEIIAAAKAAHAHEFVSSFPAGYATFGRRARHQAVRRRAPTHRHRTRAGQERAHHPA